MKKIVIIMIIISIFIFNNKTEAVTIPDDAIRIRVVANSNTEYDQSIKIKVKELLEIKMYNLLKNVRGVDNARTTIKDSLSDIDSDINKLLINEQYDLGYDIKFGQNYFPEKTYKGVKYEEGYYESLVVTLGKGEGENWWCVLFPPLCLIEAEESEEVEYKFFVQELIDKYLT